MSVAGESNNILEQSDSQGCFLKSNSANAKCLEKVCSQQTIAIKVSNVQTTGTTFLIINVMVNTIDSDKSFKK